MATVFFFGPLADVLDTGSVQIDIKRDDMTVRDVIGELAEKGANWQRYLNPDNLQVTINRQFSDIHARVTASDEVALIPRPGTI